MRKLILVIAILGLAKVSKSTDTLRLTSPSGKVLLKVWMQGQLFYNIEYNDSTLLSGAAADIIIDEQPSFSHNNAIKSHRVENVRNTIISPLPEKRKKIADNYAQLTIRFKKPYTVHFRVYDDGVAYRFNTAFKDSITVQKEIAEFNFSGETSTYFPAIKKKGDADIFHTGFEELYTLRQTDSIMGGELGFTPMLVRSNSSIKIAICESDLIDYPGMFLTGTGKSSLHASFAGYPLEERLTQSSNPQMIVTKRANFIARTVGKRSFPWRVLMISSEDKSLPSNDLVYRLASPSKISDVSWIQPGKGTDEWIININLFNVDFRTGINTESYKYYIDFAKRFGFTRIMMDAGWSDIDDLFKINPDLDMEEILAYAKDNDIKVSMWTLAHTLGKQLDSALNRFDKWGVDYIMTDFIDRDDQVAVNFYQRIAQACADHRMMIMFHGASPQKGFNRTYPNNVTREAVLGSEFNVWSDNVTPTHDVTLPYTRMLAGSFDYEPGILSNANKKSFRIIGDVVQSQGTRSHQLAMFVVYDCPMPLFAGNPSQGYMEPDFMELLGSLPSTWDETIILDGSVAEYIVTSRQKNADWFIAGMTDWSERDIEIDFKFLQENANYKATICRDGTNADRFASDYKIEKRFFKKGDLQKIHLAPGGGFLMKLEMIEK